MHFTDTFNMNFVLRRFNKSTAPRINNNMNKIYE